VISIVRTNAKDPEFVRLVEYLDSDLAKRDGEDAAFYRQFNQIDSIRYVVLAYEDETPVGCGAIKEFSPDTVEIKRMFVSPRKRQMGIGTTILAALESWAAEQSYARCILETGIKQPEAIGLYKKAGYRLIPNFGQYAGVHTSVCFEKAIATVKPSRIETRREP
jgi:GNAT superfamily N-acetyltransferase